jgi:hypothetical protein
MKDEGLGMTGQAEERRGGLDAVATEVSTIAPTHTVLDFFPLGPFFLKPNAFSGALVYGGAACVRSDDNRRFSAPTRMIGGMQK